MARHNTLHSDPLANRIRLSMGCLLVSLLLPGGTMAVESVRVDGLFRDRAVLTIDGVRIILRTGQTSPDGITLVSANAREAVIEFNGIQKKLKLGSGVAGGQLSSPDAAEIRLVRERGSYYTQGLINGSPVKFVVDTGATGVVMNKETAKKVGIIYRAVGRRVGGIQTASGTTHGYAVMLDSVRVGPIEVRYVPAIVLEGTHPLQVLLGMTFLRNLEIRQEENVLLLRKKF